MESEMESKQSLKSTYFKLIIDHYNWSLVEKYRQRPQWSDKTNIEIIMEVPKARVDVLFPFSGFI